MRKEQIMGNNHFANLARKLVCEWKNKHLSDNEKAISISDVYVVWITKVLQNNKALLATECPDGLYFEVTYNGDKNEIYLDAYKKEQNIGYSLDELTNEIS